MTTHTPTGPLDSILDDDAQRIAERRFTPFERQLLAALKTALPAVERDAYRALDLIVEGEDATGHADGAVAILDAVRAALAKAEDAA